MLLPFFEKFGIDVSEFVFTSGINFNFVSVLRAPDDASVEAMVNIVYSTGNFSNISCARAYDSKEYKAVFELGHDKMSAYVSSMQVAGID